MKSYAIIVSTMSYSEEESTSSFFVNDNTFFGGNNDDDEYERLSWRMDPKQSMSDWTIQIVCKGRDDEKYYVHKNILAIGPRKSCYFERVFHSSQLQECSTSTSQIVLEKTAADAVPALLDFMYSKDIDMTTNQAGALRVLAQYFIVNLLYHKMMTFIREDINMTNVYIYIQNAIILEDFDMVAFAGTLIAKNIHELTPSSPLLETIDPKFFLEIITSPEIDHCGMSCHLSTLVAIYCQRDQHEISLELFDALTDQKHLPVIDKHAALTFLELQSGLAINQSSEISCLQKRCIHVMLDDWKDCCSLSQISSIERFLSPVLVKIIQKMVKVANLSIQHHQTQISQMEEQLHELQRGMAGAKNDNERLEQSNRDLQELLLERDGQLAQYQQEWGKLYRVPATHSFLDTRVCTYHHEPAAGPFGKREPTGMPQIGQLSDDGYLYLQKNGNLFDRWPVLYYKDHRA